VVNVKDGNPSRIDLGKENDETNRRKRDESQ
jgi:hypothetical protein